jgi:Fe2+ transport system protein FeoA
MSAPDGGDREILALSRVKIGERVRVVHLATSHPDQLLRLSNLGIVPGAVVELRQRRPAVVLAVGESRVALDPEITEGIWVKAAED